MSLAYELVPVMDLTPDPQNARTHSKRNIELIAESLKEFGQRKPIVIDSNGVILAGNGTTEAAKRLGWAEIFAVILPKDWTKDQKRAFAIVDNRTAELAKWNAPLLAAQLEQLQSEGFTPTSLGFDLPEAPEAQQNPTHEIDVDAFDFDHKCPDCGFEFNGR